MSKQMPTARLQKKLNRGTGVADQLASDSKKSLEYPQKSEDPKGDHHVKPEGWRF